MARVYAVEDPATGRHRAVKLLTQRGMAWTRFGREYRALARLDHPNIVKVYRYGVDEHLQAYLVMELLDGDPIQVWAARYGEPGAPERSAAVVHALIGLAEALGYLHARRYIHRDLKSNNVLVLDDGTAKLLDFGATRGIGPDASSITRLGEFVGTFTYASPEQIDGDDLDERSDLYSLGVLAYRLLCGRPPFEADSAAAISRMHFERSPEPPHQRVPGIPEPLSQLVLTLLAKRPEDRVQSAPELADALRLLAGDGATGRWGAGRDPGAPPRLTGRRGARQALEAMVERARPGRMALIVGRPGSGRDRMLAEARDVAEAAGFEPWKVRIADDGGLELRLWGPSSAAPQGLEAFVDAIDAGGRAVALCVRHIERAPAAGIEALKRLRELAVQRSLPLLVFASVLDRADSGLLRLAFMDAARIALRPLTRGEVTALVDAMVGAGVASRRTAGAIFGATGAQPGFVVQVVQAMVAGSLFAPERTPVGIERMRDRSEGRVVVPKPVRRALAHQLGALPQASTRLLVAVALAEDAAAPEVVQRALGLSPDQLQATVGALIRQGILAEPGPTGVLELAVKLAAPALLDRVGERDRAHLLERLAEALPGPGPSLAAVGIFAAARRHDEAQDELVRCYQASRTGFDLAQQSVLVGEVVGRATRQQLAHPTTLARLEACWARTVAAVDLDDPRVDEALDRAEKLVVAPDVGAELALERARIHGLRGEGPEQERTLAQAEQTLGRGGSPTLRHHVQLARSGHALRGGSLGDAEQRAVGALALATRCRDPHGQGRARIAHAVSLRARGRLTQADGQLVAARGRLSRDADDRSVWLADLERAALLRLQGRFSESLELLEPQLERARDASDAPRILSLLPELVHVELDLYRLGDARELLAELADMGLAARHPVSAAALAYARGRLVLASGAPGRAVEALAEAASDADGAGLVVASHRLRGCLGQALGMVGDSQRAATACQQAIDGLATVGHLPALAEACACRMRGLGFRIDPAVCFGPVLPWLNEQPMRLARMTYLLACGTHAAARGDGRGAHYAYLDARALMDEISETLSPEIRAAFRVHPWFRELAKGDDQGSAWKGRR